MTIRKNASPRPKPPPARTASAQVAQEQRGHRNASSKPRPAAGSRGRGTRARSQHPRLEAEVDMGGDQRQPARRQMRAHRVGEQRHRLGVERHRRLVQHPDRPPRHQQPRQPQPPLLPRRQVLRRPRRAARRGRTRSSAGSIVRAPKTRAQKSGSRATRQRRLQPVGMGGIGDAPRAPAMTRPPSAGCSPASVRRSVVLPIPFGPAQRPAPARAAA